MTPLAQAMDERGQTVAQVAAAAGLNRQTIQRLRDGARPPQPRTAERIARAVGVAAAELFPDADVPELTPLATELSRRHVSVREIARAAGVHENSVYAWAAGKASPTAEKAVRLAETLDVPAAQLFPAAPRRPRSDLARSASDTRLARVAPEAAAPTSSARPVPTAEAAPFVRRVAEAMAARNLSAGAVAMQAGVSRETISRWLSGATSPQRDAAEKVAAALNLPLEAWTPAVRSTTPLGLAMAEHGWSAEQLAEAAGVEVDTTRRWIAGRNKPALAHAQRVAAVLDRPLIDLLALQPGAAPVADLTSPPQQHPPVPTPAEVLARRATGQEQWREDAACATNDDPDRWWPAPGDPGLEARAVCGGCPVLGDCRDAYLTQPGRPEDRDGIWAGLTGHQLRTAARAQAHEPPGMAATPKDTQPALASAARLGAVTDLGRASHANHRHLSGGERDALRVPPPATDRPTGRRQELVM